MHKRKKFTRRGPSSDGKFVFRPPPPVPLMRTDEDGGNESPMLCEGCGAPMVADMASLFALVNCLLLSGERLLCLNCRAFEVATKEANEQEEKNEPDR